MNGLALKDFDRHKSLIQTWPPDWRANYQTWQPRLVKVGWPTPETIGNARAFNDYPCVDFFPAFSGRAVDLLRDLLEPNGEILPLKHALGTYYFFNCTRMCNCIDLSKSKVTKLKDGIVTSTEKLVFIEETLEGLTIFKVRTQLVEVFCTQQFVDRVEQAGLQGFLFVPIWPLPAGVTFHQERYRAESWSDKWKPREGPKVDIKAHTVMLRLYCDRKKATKAESASAEDVMKSLEAVLYEKDQTAAESYFGNVEGHEVVDHEVRVFLSAPDCDRLIVHIMPVLQSLPWPGKFQVVKQRGELFEEEVPEEYVPIVRSDSTNSNSLDA